MSKTCTYCGSVLKENAKFCTQCGRAVIAESPQRVEQRKSCGDMPGERNSGKAAMEQRNSGSSTPGQAHGMPQVSGQPERVKLAKDYSQKMGWYKFITQTSHSKNGIAP